MQVMIIAAKMMKTLIFFFENNVAADDNADDCHVESTLWYADKGSMMTMIKRPYVRSTPSLLITMIKIIKTKKCLKHTGSSFAGGYN